MTSLPKKMKFTCTVCNLEIGGTACWEVHLAGKKHQLNQQRAELNHKREENGLFITGFSPKAQSRTIHDFLKRFGEVLDFYYNIEKRFVLTTYKEKHVADRLLNSKSGIFYHGQRLKIKPRRPVPMAQAEDGDKDPGLPGIDHERVTSILTSGGSLDDFLNELMPSEDEKAKYDVVLNDIKSLFSVRFPLCEVEKFGSSRTGLNVKGSDLDVLVKIIQPENSTGNDLTPIPEPEKMVRIGNKLMLQNQKTFSKIRSITRAKTPIVKCVHRPTQVSCDISFKNQLGIMNSDLIHFYLTLDSRVFPYFMIIRYWAMKHEISGAGKMSNYALVTIAAFYLQQLDPPVLPTVYKLLQLCKEEEREDGWICSFCRDPKAIEPSKNTSSLFELLAGFFEFFKDFDFKNMVICNLTAVSLPKVLFLQPEKLPEPIRKEYLKVPEGKYGLRLNTDMVVQDPFELNRNVTASMGNKAYHVFLAYCEEAIPILKNALQEPDDKRIPFLNDLFNKETKVIFNKLSYYCIKNNEITMNFVADDTLPAGYLVANPESDFPLEIKPEELFEFWVELVYKLVRNFLDKIMRLEIKDEPTEPSASKIQKIDSTSDIHDWRQNSSGKWVLLCQGNHRLWEGRKKLRKTLPIPLDMDCFKAEEMITEEILNAPERDPGFESGPGLERGPNSEKHPDLERGPNPEKHPDLERGPNPEKHPDLERGPNPEKHPDLERGPNPEKHPDLERGPNPEKHSDLEKGPIPEKHPDLERDIDLQKGPDLESSLTEGPVVSIKCEVLPIREPPSMQFVFKDTGCQRGVFTNIMMFFNKQLPILLDKYLKSIIEQKTLSLQTAPIPDSEESLTPKIESSA